jgi:hypothetical protein
MSIVLIGKIQEEIKAALAKEQIEVAKYVDNVSDFRHWLELEQPSFGTTMKVIVMPSGILKAQDKKMQVQVLEQTIPLLGEGTELAMFIKDESLYTDIIGERWLTYQPSSVDYSDKVKLQDLIKKAKFAVNGPGSVIPPKQPEPVKAVNNDDPFKTTGVPYVSREQRPVQPQQKTKPQVAPPAQNTQQAQPQANLADNSRQVEAEVTPIKEVNYTPPVKIYSGKVSKSIVICSLQEGSGSTFVGINLASLLSAENVSTSLIEYATNTPVLYEYLNGKRNAPDNWKSIVSKITRREELTKRDYWKEENVTWFPNDPNGSGIKITGDLLVNHMIATKVAQLTILDISHNWTDRMLEPVYAACDEIWVVLRPNVARLKEPVRRLKATMTPWHEKVKFIGNGFDTYTSSGRIIDAIDDLISSARGTLDGTKVRKTEASPFEGKYMEATIPLFKSILVNKSEWAGKVFTKLPEASLEGRNGFADAVNLLKTESLVSETRRGLMGKIMFEAEDIAQ